MRKRNIKIFIMGIVAVIAIAMTAIVWTVKSFVPTKEISVVNIEKSCPDENIVNDMSDELLSCYEGIDRCNKFLNACVDSYMKLEAKETSP